MTEERRVDALTGTPVVLAAHRQGRPNLPTGDCPFCVGGLEAPEPYDVRWFPNRWPSLGDGRVEVVLFSPEHEQSLGALGADGVRKVVDLWAARTTALGARPDVDYVLAFENRGADVGATIPHPHGQIYAYGDVPPVPAGELALAAARGTCALCDGQRADDASGRLVASAGTGAAEWRAEVPHASGHPYGLLIAPTAHVGSLPELDDAARNAMATVLADALGRLDRRFAEATPYMLWIHQRPTDGADWPLAHLHLEVVPLRREVGVNRYVAGAELGSGTLVNSVDPLDAARALREA